MHAHGGFGVITCLCRAAALCMKYSCFNHINYDFLKKMNVFYDYLRTTACSENSRSIKQGTLIGHVHEIMCELTTSMGMVTLICQYFTLNYY